MINTGTIFHLTDHADANIIIHRKKKFDYIVSKLTYIFIISTYFDVAIRRPPGG